MTFCSMELGARVVSGEPLRIPPLKPKDGLREPPSFSSPIFSRCSPLTFFALRFVALRSWVEETSSAGWVEGCFGREHGWADGSGGGGSEVKVPALRFAIGRGTVRDRPETTCRTNYSGAREHLVQQSGLHFGASFVFLVVRPFRMLLISMNESIFDLTVKNAHAVSADLNS